MGSVALSDPEGNLVVPTVEIKECLHSYPEDVPTWMASPPGPAIECWVIRGMLAWLNF